MDRLPEVAAVLPRDLALDDGNGLLQWSESALRDKPAMVSAVAGYFAQRKEDD